MYLNFQRCIVRNTWWMIIINILSITCFSLCFFKNEIIKNITGNRRYEKFPWAIDNCPPSVSTCALISLGDLRYVIEGEVPRHGGQELQQFVPELHCPLVPVHCLVLNFRAGTITRNYSQTQTYIVIRHKYQDIEPIWIRGHHRGCPR